MGALLGTFSNVNMSERVRVKFGRFESGERLPFLVDSATGLPLWHPTLFVLTQMRARHLASSTMEKALRAIIVAEQALTVLGVDLQANLVKGRLLNAGQLDEFAELAGLTQEALNKRLEPRHVQTKTAPKPRRNGSLESLRMGASAARGEPCINDASKGERLIYMRDYIKWRAHRHLLSLGHDDPRFQPLSAAVELFAQQLSERIPPVPGIAERPSEGLDPQVRLRMMEVIDPSSAENPWKNEHARKRNQLFIRWLHDLGLRRSELLGVRLGDLNLRANEVTVVRRADDPDEHRKDAPNVKTRGRLLVLADELADLTRTYVHELRANISGAAGHSNLFVATGSGAAMSKSAVAKVFKELRTKVPGLPDELCPHILRHSWNDDFSELMDRQRVPPEKEEKWRRQQMGWADSSRMPAVYTRRHTRRKANEASLAMQSERFSKKVGK